MNDAEFFMELDDHSKPLREAAGELATVYQQYGDKSDKNMCTLYETLKQLKISPVEQLDELILKINEQAEQVSIEFNKTHQDKEQQVPRINEAQLTELLNKSDVFVAEAMHFSDLANRLLAS